jgi:lia operon protein LiaF
LEFYPYRKKKYHPKYKCLKKEGKSLKKSIPKTLFSITLLVLGVILLLISIGVISLEIKKIFVIIYPFLLFIYGSLSLYHISLKRKNNLFFTLFILVFSILLILDRFQVLEFGFVDFWRLWPLVIILLALRLISPKKFSFEYDNGGNRYTKKSFRIGDVKYNTDNWSVEPMHISHGIGDVYIDFSKAFIPEGETELFIHARIGDIKIIVPDDLAMNVTAEAKIGEVRILQSIRDGLGNSLEYVTPDYEEAIKKIKLNILINIGDIAVQKV